MIHTAVHLYKETEITLRDLTVNDKPLFCVAIDDGTGLGGITFYVKSRINAETLLVALRLIAAE